MYLILSNGHSATRWISKLLSKDNFSKCYHSDSLLKIKPNIKNIVSYHKFLKEYNSREKLIVGSIHLPFGLNEESIEELNKLNVKIFFLIRNPVDKINSMMQFYLKKFVSNGFFTKKKNSVIKDSKNGDLYVEDVFKECKEQININFTNYLSSKNNYYIGYAYDSLKFKIYKKFYNLESNETLLFKKKHNQYLSKVIINLFLFVCSSCLRFDKQAINFNQNKIILFEEIIQSEENFLNFSKMLNDKFSLENLNIDNFSNKIGKNVKNYNNRNFWPETFEDYFLKRVKEKNLYRFYNKMGYEIN